MDYVGSWVTSSKIAEELTYERALIDLSVINSSPTEFDFSFDRAVRVASRKLNVDFLTLLWDAVFYDAQVSSV